MVTRHLPEVPVRQTSIETTALSITLLAVATIVYYKAGTECGFPRTPPKVEKGELPLLPTDEMIQQAEKVMQDLTEGVECPPGSAPNGNTSEGDRNRVIDGFPTMEDTPQPVRKRLGLDEPPGVIHVRHPERSTTGHEGRRVSKSNTTNRGWILVTSGRGCWDLKPTNLLGTRREIPRTYSAKCSYK